MDHINNLYGGSGSESYDERDHHEKRKHKHKHSKSKRSKDRKEKYYNKDYIESRSSSKNSKRYREESSSHNQHRIKQRGSASSSDSSSESEPAHHHSSRRKKSKKKHRHRSNEERHSRRRHRSRSPVHRLAKKQPKLEYKQEPESDLLPSRWDEDVSLSRPSGVAVKNEPMSEDEREEEEDRPRQSREAQDREEEEDRPQQSREAQDRRLRDDHGRAQRDDNNDSQQSRNRARNNDDASNDSSHQNGATGEQWGKPEEKKEEEDEEPTEKDKPNLGLSGKLTEDANTYKGVVIKYSQPAEARKPKRRWRWYIFKGEEELPFLSLHRQSAYLIGRERRVVDVPTDHPSCSKQHAVLQYRLVRYTKADNSAGRTVKPYIIDLDSANGTYVNNRRIPTRSYVELLEKDVVKFGYSSREYVLLHETSKDSDADEGSADGGLEMSPVSALLQAKTGRGELVK